MSAIRTAAGDVRAWLGMFRMRLISGMQYRTAAWAGVATQFCWGFMYLAIYMAFFQGSTADPGMTMEQLACYIWLQQSLFALVALWVHDTQLLGSIQDGSVAYEFCRPVGLYGLWFSRLLGTRLANVALRVWPVALVAALLPSPYRLTLPPTAGAAGLFLLSISLSALLVVTLSMFTITITFLTLSSRGSRMLVGMAADFFAGTLLPIPLMPQGMQRVLEWLPFRYVLDFPVRLYSGHIAGAEAARGLALQAGWLILLLILGVWAFTRASRRVIVQGG